MTKNETLALSPSKALLKLAFPASVIESVRSYAIVLTEGRRHKE